MSRSRRDHRVALGSPRLLDWAASGIDPKTKTRWNVSLLDTHSRAYLRLYHDSGAADKTGRGVGCAGPPN